MSIDPRILRQTFGQFATGVTVIAAELDGVVHAMTANSFASLSLDPPLVLFCAGKAARAGQVLQQAGRFCVNILHEGQQDQSSYFAGAWKDAEPPSYAFETWQGAPRLLGSAAVICCQTHAIHEGGDHWIVVGQVVAVDWLQADVRPLLFFRGQYVALDDSAI